MTPCSRVFMSKARSYVFTYNNYPESYDRDDALDTWLNGLGSKYSIAGREISPTTKTRHLQGYVQFANPKTVTVVRKLLAGCHVEIAKGTPQQCREYSVKDGNFREVGLIPICSGDREKQRWENARILAKEGKFDDIPADIYVRYVRNLELIYRKTLPPLEPMSSTTGIWLVGSTGAGKSRGTRKQYPALYPKPLNKWWDGYSEQPIVLIDDVDCQHSSWLGNFLKIWADHYPYIAEMKGGSRLIRPEKIIVTSQYNIVDLFKDIELQMALIRRFRIINVYPDIAINWP